MSVVMTFVLALALGTATVVMAAVGSDGLEYFDEPQMYLTSSAKFDFTVDLSKSPYWLSDITDTGQITATVKNFDTILYGGIFITPYQFLTLTGEKSSVSFISMGECLRFRQEAIQPNRHFPKYEITSTKEYTTGAGIVDEGFKGLCSDSYGDTRVYITYLFSASDSLDHVELSFDRKIVTYNIRTDDEINFLTSTPKSEFDNNFVYDAYVNDLTGNHKSGLFSKYESEYENKAVPGISIKVDKAIKNEITLDIADENNQFSYITYELFDMTENPCRLALSGGAVELHDKLKISTTDEKYITEYPENAINPEKTYKLNVMLYNQDNNVVYRWQKYITIQ